jgi:poly-beta-1,6-N-acetyl-D-glucosamine biosynthesis protein PgaD
MTEKLERPWPPLITDARMPRVMVWRDRITTAAMWLLLLYFVQRELFETWGEAVELFGRESAPDASWPVWWETLRPYLVTAAVLGLWLLGWSIVTIRRIHQAGETPEQPPLSLAEQARRAGCSEAELATWRTWRVVRVELDDQMKLSVVPGNAVADPPAKD